MPKVTIIAEAGVNHNGSVELAKLLIDAANEAGADYVKFQTFRADTLLSAGAVKASYQKANTDNNETQYDMLKRLELSDDMHDELISYCLDRDIGFLSTPFDERSISFLKQKGITIGKIPSGEITNLPYLRAMAKAYPELILSTGMCSMEEVRASLDALLEAGADKRNITILHCNTEYPTPMEDVNLRAMVTIKHELDVKIGYSDHTEGVEIPIAAVALGATLIEKHFTLDRSMEGPDHKASLEPGELKHMIKAIRNVEKAMAGSGLKEASPSEIKNIAVARKSIVAAKAIGRGTVLTSENISVKRPGTGINPMHWDEVIGTKAIKDFETDELIIL